MTDPTFPQPSPNGTASKAQPDEPTLGDDVRALADLLSDLAQWVNGLLAVPGVLDLVREGGGEEAMWQNRLMLFAICAGAEEIAERRSEKGEEVEQTG